MTTPMNPTADTLCWYAMRAYHKEKQAEAFLQTCAEVGHFIAWQEAVRIYHGQKYLKQVPALPSIVFVRGSRLQINLVKRKIPFLQYIRQGDGYLVVPDRQMDNFILAVRRAQGHPAYLTPAQMQMLRLGDRVRIHGGPFDGIEAHFIRQQGTEEPRVIVRLGDMLGLEAEVHADFLEPLTPP